MARIDRATACVEDQPAETEGVELDQPPRPIQMLIRIDCVASALNGCRQLCLSPVEVPGRHRFFSSFATEFAGRGGVFSIDVGGDRVHNGLPRQSALPMLDHRRFEP